jgi:hypothetical protein
VLPFSAAHLGMQNKEVTVTTLAENMEQNITMELADRA